MKKLHVVLIFFVALAGASNVFEVDRPLRRAMVTGSAPPTLFLSSSDGALDPPCAS
jgi:hypothetical protein